MRDSASSRVTDPGSFLTDTGETAVQGIIVGTASTYADADVKYQVIRSLVVDGVVVPDLQKPQLLAEANRKWLGRLVGWYLHNYRRETNLVIASEIDYVIGRIKDDLSDGSNLVIVAHSQGTLFAEEVMIAPKLTDSERSRIRVVGVGNAAGSTWNGRYLTLGEDLVVQAYGLLTNTVNSVLGINRAAPLPANSLGYYAGPEGIAGFWSMLQQPICASRSIKCIEVAGHGFSSVYMNTNVLQSEQDLTQIPYKIIRLVTESIAELPNPSLSFIDDFLGSSLDTTKWAVEPIVAACCGAGNLATYSVSDGFLNVNVPGGSCGACGVSDGAIFRPKIDPLTSDFEVIMSAIEVQRASRDSTRALGNIQLNMVGTNQGFGVYVNGDAQNNSGTAGHVVTGYYYSGNTSTIPIQRQLTVGQYYSMQFRARRLSGRSFVAFKVAGDADWTEFAIPASFPGTTPFTPRVVIATGDGGGTRINSILKVKLDSFSIAGN